MKACVVIMILLAIVLAALCTTIACRKEGYVLSPGGGALEKGLSVCPGATVPIGTIVPFYQAGKDGELNKSVIPFGWWICDGSTDPDTKITTPNLSGKYLMGASSSAGLKMVNTSSTFETTLTEDQVPLRSHDHAVSFLESDGRDSHGTGYPTAVVGNNGLNLTTGTSELAATESLKIPVSEYIPNFPIVYIMYVGTRQSDRACADNIS